MSRVWSIVFYIVESDISLPVSEQIIAMLLKIPRYPDMIHCFLQRRGGSETTHQNLQKMIKFPKRKNPGILFWTFPCPPAPLSLEPGGRSGPLPSSSPLLPGSIPHTKGQLNWAFSCHSPVLTVCQQHSDTFHRNSKCLTRLNKACLTQPLPSLISSLSSFHSSKTFILQH